jgi:hypothetical protein
MMFIISESCAEPFPQLLPVFYSMRCVHTSCNGRKPQIVVASTTSKWMGNQAKSQAMTRKMSGIWG